MHIASFEIENVRGIKRVKWTAPKSPHVGHDSPLAGWHVIIGDNGSGKSTVLRSVALAILGPGRLEALRQNWNNWISANHSIANIKMHVSSKGADDELYASYPGTYRAHIRLERDMGWIGAEGSDLWTHSKMFSAGFGPYRRFSGGVSGEEEYSPSHAQLMRHLSVFGENVALTECLAWLKQLKFEELDKKTRSGKTLRLLKQFVNQDGFLPQHTRFKGVNSQGVEFVDGRSQTVGIEALGDGFRSILSLTFDLLRHMALARPDSELFKEHHERLCVRHPAVVLIDEIDAHLHPTWQRQIGHWLTKHFPKVQFIVTSHSPLVCQAAEHGSIFRLPAPGSDEQAAFVEGIDRDRLVFGSVLDAYGTELFGSDISRSETALQKQERLAELNKKAILKPDEFTDADAAERERLRDLFPAIA